MYTHRDVSEAGYLQENVRALLRHCREKANQTRDVRIKVILRRTHVTITAEEKQ